MPLKVMERTVFKPDGTSISSPEERVDRDRALEIAWQGPSWGAELTDLVNVVVADPTLKPLLISHASTGTEVEPTGRRFQIALHARYTLDNYLELHPSLTWSDETFDAVCERLARFLASPAVPTMFVFPLEGLTLQAQRLELADGVWLQPFSAEDQSDFREEQAASIRLFGALAFEIAAWRAALCLHAERPSWGSLAKRPPWETIDEVLAAIRIHGGTDVGAFAAWEEPAEPSYSMRGSTMANVRARRRVHTDLIATLEADDEAPLRAALDFIRIAVRGPRPEDHRFALAIRRFNSSFDRSAVDDRLIDTWIALEALFLPDGNTELVRRISLRIARFLETTPSERQSRYQRVKKLYDTRSKIIHGDSPAPTEELVRETRALLREILARIVASGQIVDVDALDFG